MNAVSEIPVPEEQDEEELTAFKQKRKELREKLLTAKILGEIDELVFTGSFDGSGDSGQYNNDASNREVNEFFSEAIDQFVTFNWYDGEGGAGDITWDVVADKITINGYSNYIAQETEMDEEVF